MSNRALAFTAEHLLQILKSFPAVNSYIVGFSGGADSTALLHALAKIHPQLDAPVAAVHVNHGLHADADRWQSQCEDFCRQHGIELTCLKIDLKNRAGRGLEAEARHLRYETIASLLNPADCLLTAHHADDQAETLLLNLMRGSGVDGLSGMPECRPLGAGFLQRPLLRFKNSALRRYLRENNIAWSEDPSNRHLDHDRNFVRHAVIPLLEQRWPQVGQRLMLTGAAMADARHLLERLADEYLGLNPGLSPFVLHITPQCRAHPELFKLVVRRWIKRAQAPGIPAYKLDSICAQVRRAENDHNISVHWGDWTLRWYKDRLWLHASVEISPCPVVVWPPEKNEVDLGTDVGRLVLSDGTASGNRPDADTRLSPDGDFSVGGRVNMATSVISLGGHHKSLKNLFQSADIPPWLRNSIPLCRLDGELVAIGDWCFNERFASWLNVNGIHLSWCPRHPLLQFILQQQHRVNIDG